eukprot:COSAG06_NODE_32532_length_504_cov_1.079012_1_plen_31_part_10
MSWDAQQNAGPQQRLGAMSTEFSPLQRAEDA